MAACIVLVLPVEYWYKTALRLTFLHRFICIRRHRNISTAFTRAGKLNSLLAYLTRANKPFPIPCTITGLEVLENKNRGTAFCTVHLPLAKVAISAVISNGYHIDAAIVASPTADRLMSVWGITQKIPTIESNKHSLLKAKTILHQNGSVLLMLDALYGEKYSPNIMHLAGKTSAQAIFFLAELNPSGIIDIQILQFPNPYCENETAVAENIQFVSDAVEKVLARYRNRSFWQ